MRGNLGRTTLIKYWHMDGEDVVLFDEYPKTERVPEQLLIKKHHYYNRPSTGREQGQYVLSPAGWRKYKNKLKKKYLSSPDKEATWEDVEKAVKDFYTGLIEGTRKHTNTLNNKLKESKHALSILEK